MKKVSKIKERIKKIAEQSPLTQESFFKEIGVTPANFRGKKLETGVNSELLEKIISIYPEVNLYWLLTGKQNPYREVASEGKFGYVNLDFDYKDELIVTQKKLIDVQKELNVSKDTIISLLKASKTVPKEE